MNLYNYHTHSFSLYIVNNKFAKLGHDSFFILFKKWTPQNPGVSADLSISKRLQIKIISSKGKLKIQCLLCH